MTSARILSFARRPYGSLKEATARLIDASGGVERAAERCRLGKSRLSECASPYAEDANLPADVVLALELSAGAQPVTAYLAAAHHCVLVRLPPPEDRGKWARNIARAAKETAEAFSLAAVYLEDGKIEGAEAPDLLREVDEAMAAFGDLREMLLAAMQGEGK